MKTPNENYVPINLIIKNNRILKRNVRINFNLFFLKLITETIIKDNAIIKIEPLGAKNIKDNKTKYF